MSSADILRFGRFELDRKSRELRKDGLKVRLQDQPYQVLALLLERPGDVVTRDELRARLWPADTYVDFERGLNNAVRRLRDALGDSAETPRFVDTLPRQGYRFIAPLEGHVSPVPPVPAVPQEPRMLHATRRRGAALAGGAAIVLGAALAAVLIRPRPPEPPVMRPLTHSGRDSCPAASPDGRRLAFVSERDGRRRIWLKDYASGEEEAITTGPEDSEPRFSPDGASLLFTRVQGGMGALYRVSIPGGELHRLLDGASSGDWSPDGGRLAWTRLVRGERPAYVLGVARPDGSEAREIALVDASWASPPRWWPDARRLAMARRQGAFWSMLVVDSASGEQRSIAPAEARGALSVPIWSGGELLFIQSDAPEWRSGRLIRRTLGWGGRSESLLHLLAIGPGLDRAGPGRIVFDARRVRYNLREHPLRAGVASWPRWLTRGDGEDRQPSYTPDGGRVVFASSRGGNPDLWEASLATGRLRRLTDDPAEDVEPQVLGGGRIVWASRRSGSFEVWIAESDGSAARQLTHDGGDVAHPVGSPSGRWILYTARRPDRAGLWMVRADASQLTPLVPGRVGPASFSPDGDYVVFTEMRPSQTVLRVFRLGDTRLLPAEVELSSKDAGVPWACFVPGGRSVAFLDVDDEGRTGIFVQDFDPLRGITGRRRPLTGFDPDLQVDSFAFSPDGQRLTIAYSDTQVDLMLADGLPAVRP